MKGAHCGVGEGGEVGRTALLDDVGDDSEVVDVVGVIVGKGEGMELDAEAAQGVGVVVEAARVSRPLPRPTHLLPASQTSTASLKTHRYQNNVK